MYGTTSKASSGGSIGAPRYADIETGYESTGALYPGIGYSENSFRWGFIRKVYGILSTQLVSTAIVAGVVVFCEPIAHFFAHNIVLLVLLGVLPLIVLCPLYNYQHRHPVNLVLLGFFSVFLSLSVGVSCAFIRGRIVLEALVLTATVSLTLTAYTYWAAKQGHDFSFLGPLLLVSVVILMLWGIIQMFFPLGPISHTIYAALTTVIFSGYIVYDTDNLIKRFSYDEHIWASVCLYLDILNLFLALVNLLRGLNSDD